MACNEIALKIKHGSVWNQLLRLKTKDPVTGVLSPRNLTGLKARGQIRRSVTDAVALASFDSASPATLTISAAAGELTFKLTAAQCEALPNENKAQRWVFDFELYDDAGYVESHDEWLLPVLVSPNVTRP